MNERQLSNAIRKFAELRGWRVFTISNTKAAGLRAHTAMGWPDLFMVRGGEAVAAELKVKGRVTTEAQDKWLAELYRVPGIRTFVWRESSWMHGEVESVLK